MNVQYVYALLAVIVLFLLSYVGAGVTSLQILFGVVIPYLAIIIFLAGFVYRVMDWAKVPVPFRIPTTAGQSKSLPWIKQNKVDCPTSTGGVILRMLGEVLLFRSLFRNTKCEVNDSGRITYELELWLWLAALAFHYSFLVVLIRHMRFFLEPVPGAIQLLEKVDGFLQIGQPGLYISGAVLLAAVLYLFLRRVYLPQMRYISLASDYFPLFLIMGIAITGIVMRYFAKIDVIGAKQIAIGLVTLRPTVPEGVGALFYAHMFLVSVLLAYFPFSKLMHLGGIFLSPTRNLPNDTRMRRHVNPWNYPVKVHTYDEYEEEFREKMIEAGLPVEKE